MTTSPSQNMKKSSHPPSPHTYTQYHHDLPLLGSTTSSIIERSGHQSGQWFRRNCTTFCCTSRSYECGERFVMSDSRVPTYSDLKSHWHSWLHPLFPLIPLPLILALLADRRIKLNVKATGGKWTGKTALDVTDGAFGAAGFADISDLMKKAGAQRSK